MPRLAKFTAKTAAGLKPAKARVDYTFGDHPGLRLRHSPDGAMTYEYRTHVPEIGMRTIKLGRDLDFAAVVAAYGDAKASLAAGKGILGLRKANSGQNDAPPITTQPEEAPARAGAPKSGTLKALHDAYFAAAEAGQLPVRASTVRKYRYDMADVIAALGSLKLADIDADPETVRAYIDAIDPARGPAVPVTQRRAMSAVFSYGMAKRLMRYHPLKGLPNLHAKTLKKLATKRWLSADEIRQLWAAIEAGVFGVDYGRILKLALLTGLRPCEITELRKAEVDLAEACLVIRDERMKKGRTHIVPLSPLAMTILRQALADSPAGPGVFAGQQEGSIARRASLSRHVKTVQARGELVLAGGAFVPKDLRKTVINHLARIGVPGDIRRLMVAHLESDVHATSYQDGQEFERLDERRTWWNAWAKQLAKIVGAKVVKMAEAA